MDNKTRKIIFVERECGNFEETNEMTEFYNSTIEKDNGFTVFAFRLEDLVIFPQAANMSFIIIYIILIILAFVDNTLTVYKSLYRKHHILFKCFIISLAVSDIIFAVVYGVNNVPKFLLPAHNYWILGKKMCSVLPFLQTTTLLANSITLTSIAIDRYVLLVHSRHTTWHPSPWICLFFIVIIWLICAATSIPMYDMYFWAHAVIVKLVDGVPTVDHNYSAFNICMVDDKKVKNNYLLIVFILIVFPLLCVFVVLNCLIAQQIWYIRKSYLRPPQNMNMKLTLCSNITTKLKRIDTDKLKNKKKYFKNHGKKIFINNQLNSTQPYFIYQKGNKKVTEHVPSKLNTDTDIQSNSINNASGSVFSASSSRKMKTFRIIMVLVIMFLVLRSPSSIFVLISSSPNIHLVETKWWILQNVLGIFVILNSVLNPLLYCFSNTVLASCKYISYLLKRIFCAIFGSCFSCKKI